MFSWAKLIESLVSLGAAIAKYLGDRQLIEAGKAESDLEGTKVEKSKIADARDAAAHVDSVPIDDDPNNRSRVR